MENPGQLLAQNTPPVKEAPVTSGNRPKEGETRQPQEQGGDQEDLPIRTDQLNANPPTQAKQSQPDTARKIYAQVTKENPTRSTLDGGKTRQKKTWSCQEWSAKARNQAEEESYSREKKYGQRSRKKTLC